MFPGADPAGIGTRECCSVALRDAELSADILVPSTRLVIFWKATCLSRRKPIAKICRLLLASLDVT